MIIGPEEYLRYYWKWKYGPSLLRRAIRHSFAGIPSVYKTFAEVVEDNGVYSTIFLC